jgi:hypothetical protein
MKLLASELKNKRKELRKCEDQLASAQSNLKSSVSRIDYSCIQLWMKRKQNKVIENIKKTHKSKLFKLGISPIATLLDVKKVIFNYSNKVLSKEEERILLLGLDFSLPIHKLNFANYHLVFEKLFKTLNNVPMFNCVNNARNVFRSHLQTIASKYFYNFKSHKNSCPMFSRNDAFVLKNLASDRSIYVTRPDKGNGVVILNHNDYITKVHDIIHDCSKFHKIDIEENKLVVKLEDKLNNVLRSLKSSGSITENFYNNCRISGSRLGGLYGLPKVHKHNCPVRPILSACNTHNFKLGKELLPLISHLAENEFALKNSFDFVNDIQKIQDADILYMCSFDVESLYTNIPAFNIKNSRCRYIVHV